MKKKVLLVLTVAMAVTSASFASPLSNYEKGSVAIDLNTMISPDVEVRAVEHDFLKSFAAKSRLGAGVTYGIGDKLALQYKYSDNKSKDYYYYNNEKYVRESFQFTGHALNVLYQINPNVSGFVGYTRSIGKVNWADNGAVGIYTGSERDSKNGYHVGLIGKTKIADDVTGWASVSAGNGVTGYEFGIGYDVAEDTELNLFYHHTKHKDFNLGGDDVDFTTQGLGAGVTFKF